MNKILRRRTNYILPEFIPDINAISPSDAEPNAIIKPTAIEPDKELLKEINNNRCGVLSSGGKESLLTYGILKEIGAEVYPLYINESGGHWRTALPAYMHHEKNDPRTHRVWTNVDRFYTIMLDHLKIIRKDHRSVRADTYPIRLCIFPFYVFSLLPIFIDNGIGNLLIGSEFDDIRSPPVSQGITHYYGVYYQHQDYDQLMDTWYAKRIPGLKQWSAVRTISGLIVERILVKRYAELAQYQRSCHSCHFENNQIIPCGSCSKCQGVLLFLLANQVAPQIMQFKSLSISQFLDNNNSKILRLDEDEKNHAFYLIKEDTSFPTSAKIEHVEKLHVNKTTIDIECIPEQLRKKILTILESFTNGYCKLQGNNWISTKKSEI
ncbi:MAG: hypothetical protein KKC68_02685 [Candidatus Thermoplasmatota archaeon]|nr:hypothetical protein [Candidatus Thermoplasmatota archaeon]